MKKLLIAIMVFTFSFSFLQLTFADPPSGLGTTAPAAEPVKPGSKLSDLEGRKSQLEGQIEAQQNHLKTFDTRVKNAKTEVEEAKTSKNKARITSAEKVLKDIDAEKKDEAKKLKDLQREYSKNKRDIEANPEFQKNNITEYYRNLRDGIKAKGEELKAKLQDCGTCSDFEKEIIQLQIEANDEYLLFNNAKEILEGCQVEKCQEAKELEQTVGGYSTNVKTLIKRLTELEMKKNQEATLDIRKIFAVDPERPRAKRTLQQFVDTLADSMITLVTSLAVTALIIGGFILVISAGDENRLELGKTIFSYSLIGVLVTFLAYAIVSAIQGLFS